MCDESCRGLGKAKRTSKPPPEKVLRGVIRDSQTSSNSNNVLRPGAPKILINRATNKLIEVSVIHLWVIKTSRVQNVSATTVKCTTAKKNDSPHAISNTFL